MRLSKIEKEDLIFSGKIEDDRINTFLTLDDYDWMNYALTTRFRTEKLGILNVKFNYFGSATSMMEVEQILNNEITKIKYEYSTNIFKKYIIRFLTKHIASWDDQYAFCGEDVVIEFFNEVLERGNLLDKTVVYNE